MANETRSEVTELRAELRETGPTTRVVEVEVAAAVVERKLNEVYRRIVREIELPGFRRGHVPRRLLEAHFGKEILYEDAQEALIEEYLPRALEELQLRPVTQPEAKIVQFEEGKPFIFEAEVEVLPEVEVEDYLGVEVEAEPRKRVTKKEIEAELERLRREQATLVPKEGKQVELGDVAIISERIVNTRSGEVVNEEENLEVEIEPDDHFSEQLLSKNIGDEVAIPLDEGYTSYVRIEALKQVELPPLDDEFAADLGYASLEELREKIKDEIRERLEHEYEQQMKLKVLDEIIDRTPLVIPEKFIDELVKRDLEALRESGYRELSEDEIGEYKRRKTRQLKRELVLDAIKKREGLELSDEEFEELLKQEAEKREMNPAKFRGLLEREGSLERFRRDLEDERVLDFLYKHAKMRRREKEKEKEKRPKQKPAPGESPQATQKAEETEGEGE